MFEHKHKREPESTVEMGVEENGYVMEPTQVEVGSGYTVSVSYDEHDTPTINVKTYGKVDLEQLQKEIRRAFPNARIRQLAQTPSVTLVHKNKKKSKAQKK